MNVIYIFYLKKTITEAAFCVVDVLDDVAQYATSVMKIRFIFG